MNIEVKYWSCYVSEVKEVKIKADGCLITCTPSKEQLDNVALSLLFDSVCMDREPEQVINKLIEAASK